MAMAWYVNEDHKFSASSVNKPRKPAFFTELAHKIPDFIERPVGIGLKLALVIELATSFEISKLNGKFFVADWLVVHFGWRGAPV